MKPATRMPYHGLSRMLRLSELVAKKRPAGWMPPNMFQFPMVLTEAEVIEAELKALQRHAFAIVDPEVES